MFPSCSAEQEYHYPSNCHCRIGSNPIVADVFLAQFNYEGHGVAYAAACPYMDIGIEVVDEWVFSFQSSKDLKYKPFTIRTFERANITVFLKTFLNCFLHGLISLILHFA